jgi:8-oxo-dGTP pyrophosphatase MutT (NUDIX family)
MTRRFANASKTTTLAGPFLVECATDGESCCVFSFFLINDLPDLDPAFLHSDGARAWAALHRPDTHSDPHRSDGPDAAQPLQPCFELTASLEKFWEEEDEGLTIALRIADGNVRAAVDKDSAAEEAQLRSVLSRVLAQWASRWLLSRLQEAEDGGEEKRIVYVVTLPDGQALELASDLSVSETVHRLFGSPSSLSPSDEIVEMVDRDGSLLGRLPRRLIHQHNLLHRGVGVIVTAGRFVDTAITANHRTAASAMRRQPDVYVHQRTANKMIFPSLFDMFVGGLSLADELGSNTALREVSEELGLGSHPAQLSGPILRCVVCTSYNRCVVDLFCYAVNEENESVRWQEEEVAWGSFVPYEVVEAAADRSILRWAEKNQWPGRTPPIQSKRTGVTLIDNRSHDWTSWDMVPDGLLVWEAWLRLLDGDRSYKGTEEAEAIGDNFRRRN